VVLERGRVAETWRGRWDSFCLVTPNWSVQLPDGAHDGADPDGFMPRDHVVTYLACCGKRGVLTTNAYGESRESPALSV